MKRFFLISALLLIFSMPLFAQNELTGILKQDSKIAFGQTMKDIPQFNYPAQNKKSPVIAGLLSLAVPGAGEIYAGEYIKAAIFVALEAAVITTAVIYDNKGDDKTNEFQNYADGEWSVVKYAQWLNTHKGKSISIDANPNLNPWEAVNWEELNAAEAEFSHKLPLHGEQQYFELIGKYPQYSPGWKEFSPQDPEYHNVPEQMKFYSGMRGDANDFYNIASKAVIGIYVNHFLSTLDAVWSAVSFNKDLSFNIRTQIIQYADINETVPVINLKYTF